MIDALFAGAGLAQSVREAAHQAARFLYDESTPSALANGRVRAAVLRAFVAEGIIESDLAESLGYGYDDPARARYESILCRLFGTERCLARLSLVSGTHAIVTALAACAGPRGRIVAATGRPYDTLRNALVEAPGSLCEQGIGYEELDLRADGAIDYDGLAEACARGADVVFIQRSRGYAPRRSLTAQECGAAARVAKNAAPGVVTIADNCYGELVEPSEPVHHGVDVIAGSLLKNLGGGIAPGGGYVAGPADAIERVASRHFAPGLGSAVGPTLGHGRALLQGLFYAPLVVGEALRGLDAAAALFAALGYAVDPAAGSRRADVVQAIRLGSRGRLAAFARGLQRTMPVNAGFAPQPGRVPGYREPVVMSSGAFVSGSTIDLSCDAPLRDPFEVYLQGGIVREHVLLGAAFAADELLKEAK